jgi:hypothetical protein
MAVNNQHRIVNSYGEPIQQSLTNNPRDSVAVNVTKSVLGLVLSVNPPDADLNRAATQREDRRGYLHTCTVLVVEDGRSSIYTLGNVIITPDCRTGLDDYYERLPRGCSGLTTGANWNSQLVNINPYDLDGDWCVVSFLGGSLDTPFILRWWPHPKNPYDPATSGKRNPNAPTTPPYLNQTGRFLHRTNGVEFSITKSGDVYLSTYRANSTLRFGNPMSPEEGRFPRQLDDENGGSVKAWIKPSQSFELDWNVPVNGLGILDLSDPQLPQTNPENVGTAVAKQNTYVLADKDRIEIDTPEKFQLVSKKSVLLTSEEDTIITVGTDLTADVSGSCSITTPKFSLSLDETAGQLKITSRASGDSLTFDANTNTVAISATTALNLSATGLINITSTGPMSIVGSVVTINGRIVAPGVDPI